MVSEIHTQDASDTGALLNVVLKEMSVYGTDKVKIIQHSFAEIKTPEWIKHHPLEKMPYMVDTETGLELYETRTMAKYIATKVGSPLVPEKDTAAYWNFDKAFYTEAVHFYPWADKICVEVLYARPFYQRDPDTKLVEIADQELQKTMKAYERILGQQKWLGGNELTLVDLFHAILIKMCQTGGMLKYVNDGTLPNVQKWWEALDSRSSIQQAFQMKNEALKAMMG